jgi:hypothetical protein
MDAEIEKWPFEWAFLHQTIAGPVSKIARDRKANYPSSPPEFVEMVVLTPIASLSKFTGGPPRRETLPTSFSLIRFRP